MDLFPNIKTVLSIGNLEITWYAVFILTGALLAYFFSIKTLKKWGYKSELLEDFFLYMLPIGIIGARLYYVIFEWEFYSNHPIKIFYIWEGGLAIHGGILAATAFGLWYFRNKAVDGLRILDAIFPNVLLAQAIGRWGNFMNQEAFGGIVNETYYNGWPAFIKNQMYIDGAYREPTFLYESILNLCGWILIRYVYRKYGRKKRGDLAYAYLCWYGIVRVWIESMRSDALMLGSLKMAQVISVFGIFVGVAGILGIWDRLFQNIWPFHRQKPILLFDLDGTLLDSERLIFSSFRYTFQKLKPDFSLTDEILHSFMGPTLHETMTKYFDATEVEHAIQIYRTHNMSNHDAYVSLFPHVKEVLQALKDQGYTIGIVSNKLKDAVERALNLFDIQTYFDVIVAGDDVEHPKPSAEGILKACELAFHNHDDIVFIGDSAADIQACKNVGAYSVAMVYNEINKQGIEKLDPCLILDDLRQILDLMKEDFEWSDTTIW